MKLKTKLSLTFALIVLITVALISLLSNVFINHEFKKYAIRQQEQRTQEIVSSLIAQYNGQEKAFDLAFVHTIGMYALYDGFIVRVCDAAGHVLWDAEMCDMAGCMQVMNDVAERMRTKYPRASGAFTSKAFPLEKGGEAVGTAHISYYGPYFLSEEDFNFLDALSVVLFAIGGVSLALAAFMGLYLARRISEPIGKAAATARQMAGGDYAARITDRVLTPELANLYDSVNLLATSLKRQESLRKQLTADVAHELRTPLTSVQAHLEAMIEGIWEISPERLESCHEEIMRIGALVLDLEDLARVDHENAALEKAHVSLAQIAQKTIDSFEMDIQSKRLSVTVSGSAPDVLADEARIRQAVTNLVSNAIKFTPPEGHIQIALSQKDAFAALSITDDGDGIPADELPFIFERFYRADKSRNRKTGGSGIGLTIARAIAEAHRGSVSAESERGKGSCFRLMLPIEGADA